MALYPEYVVISNTITVGKTILSVDKGLNILRGTRNLSFLILYFGLEPRKNRFEPSSYSFTDRLKAILL